MILGIDAFNIRDGGGVTHLIELIKAAEPDAYGFRRVIIWGGKGTLAKIKDRDWLKKIHDPILDRSLPYRVFWHRFRLKKLARKAGCHVLLFPGGSDSSGFKPMVTMSRNMLPFEWQELRRFGWTLVLVKLMFLRWTQSKSFRKSNGVIFLTEYARNSILKSIGSLSGKNVIIPHGVNSRFSIPPRPQHLLRGFTSAHPCRVLYVSMVSVYKHQWQVAEAISLLRASGISIELELVGPPAVGIDRLNSTLNRIDPERQFVHYHGQIPYENLNDHYKKADIVVFASSCENMPNILLEGMASGLPIACSDRGPMPEVLGNAGVYFNPEDSQDIANSIQKLVKSPDLRFSLAKASYSRSQSFTWERCSMQTFHFLAEVAASKV